MRLLSATNAARQCLRGLPTYSRPGFHAVRSFQTSSRLAVVKPFLLADIGEGITECQLIQWFVQPGARVEQFDKICEVQSDKASVEITSPFDGVIKKLHYEPDEMAITGKPLVDIDIESEITEADQAKLADGPEEKEPSGRETQDDSAREGIKPAESPSSASTETTTSESSSNVTRSSNGNRHSSLATPAVRHLVKHHDLNIQDIEGTGKDGRVLKEDVHRHVSQKQAPSNETSSSTTATSTRTRDDRKVNLTPVQSQMFKVMTRSLNIPHFLYTTTADMTAVSELRHRLNATSKPGQKLTHLALILKAVSLAFMKHPLLNASLNTTDPKKPELTYLGSHNFGVAVDTPSGLLVPVIKNVQDMSIVEVATSLRQISEKARENKLAPSDFRSASFTVSNIGSVGGGAVAPVISEPQVAILGVGRSKIVPAFDRDGQLTKKEELIMSWSADHRVVDGAECARCAETVIKYLQDPASMLVAMR